jgi:hypothetical protein
MPYPSRITTKYRPKENSTGGPLSAGTGASMLAFGSRRSNSIHAVSHRSSASGRWGMDRAGSSGSKTSESLGGVEETLGVKTATTRGQAVTELNIPSLGHLHHHHCNGLCTRPLPVTGRPSTPVGGVGTGLVRFLISCPLDGWCSSKPHRNLPDSANMFPVLMLLVVFQRTSPRFDKKSIFILFCPCHAQTLPLRAAAVYRLRRCLNQYL